MRDLSGVRRVVVKVGTNVLAPDGIPDDRRLEGIATQVADLAEKGYKPLLVTSGAIGFGGRELGLSGRPGKVEVRQACAAVGQTLLMDRWRDALGTRGLTVAQILVTRETFDDRRSFLNLRNAVESLLSFGVVPVFNENDSVSVAEIGDVFGDNDNLSAHVASKLDAGLLILLTDIDAFYDKDPRRFEDARPLDVVEYVDDAIRAAAGGTGSSRGSGGMKTKIQAAEVASRAGCPTVLADGREADIVVRILDGEAVGTLFLAGRRIGARARWILGARPKGSVHVDPGATAALGRGKSLLPRGVVSVEGPFESGDVIRIGEDYRAVAAMASEDIRQVIGLHTEDAAQTLGAGRRDTVVARAEDIVQAPKGE